MYCSTFSAKHANPTQTKKFHYYWGVSPCQSDCWNSEFDTEKRAGQDEAARQQKAAWHLFQLLSLSVSLSAVQLRIVAIFDQFVVSTLA